MSHYTQSSPAVVVKVAVFRAQINHLEDLVRCDWHACVSDRERGDCLAAMQRVGCELIAMTCKRATEADMTRRERAIEGSTTLITAHRKLIAG